MPENQQTRVFPFPDRKSRPPVVALDVHYTALDMLEMGLGQASRKDEIQGLIDTYPQIDQFACNVAGFFTHVFPSTCRQLPSAIAEILDAAYRSFARVESEDGSPMSTVAAFLASGLQAAVYVLTHFNVELIGMSSRAWNPWKEGGISSIDERPIGLRFYPASSPSAEDRHAARTILQRELLQLSDMVSIHRAGIDLHAGEVFG